jgi:hypothetical protein
MNPTPAISAMDLLDAVPLRSQTVRGEKRPDGGWLLRVPLRRRWYTRPPLAWLVPLSRDRAVGLDQLGSEVWEACDGRRTVQEIVDLFAAAHDLTFHEARLSVTAFLRLLVQRGLVVVVGRPKAGLPQPRAGEAGAAR